MVVTRGVVHVEARPEDWKLDGEGLADFVQRLPDALRHMLGPDARLPRMLFTDRGTGMYSSAGKVVGAHRRAVQARGFHLYWGDDASQQSPDMGDLLLHETAVAWFRQRMMKERPAVLPWLETQVVGSAQHLILGPQKTNFQTLTHDKPKRRTNFGGARTTKFTNFSFCAWTQISAPGSFLAISINVGSLQAISSDDHHTTFSSPQSLNCLQIPWVISSDPIVVHVPLVGVVVG